MNCPRFLIVVLAVSGLASCGGGSSPGLTFTPTNPSFVSSDYVLFSSTSGSISSLKAYDPVSNSISTIPTTSPTLGMAIYDGTIDPTTKATSNYHISDVLYQDNGKFYSVSTSQNDQLAVTQRSNYSGTVCDHTLSNNYLVLVDAGNDGKCGTGDELVYAITTTMASTDAPISLPVQPVAVLFSDYSTPMGMLYVYKGILYYADANGGSQKGLVTTASASKIAVVGDDVLLDINGELEVFNGASKTLVDSGYAPTNMVNEALSDGTNFYYFDGSDLHSIPVAGGSDKFLTPIPASNFQPRFVYNNYLVYSTSDSSGNTSIASVDLANPSTGLIYYSATSPEAVYLFNMGGDYIYYQVSNLSSTDHSNDIAGVIKDDGTGQQQVTGANWTGAIYSSAFSFGQMPMLKYIELDQYALDGSGNITGGDISIYDAATDTMSSQQGSLPAGMLLFAGRSLGGSDFYGEFKDAAGSLYLAHANATIDNTMEQLDTTTSAVQDMIIY